MPKINFSKAMVTQRNLSFKNANTNREISERHDEHTFKLCRQFTQMHYSSRSPPHPLNACK